MKKVIFLISAIFLIGLNSQAEVEAGEYDCHYLKGDQDVGHIEVSGHPVLHQYFKVKIDGEEQRIKQSPRDPVYLYLYDPNNGEKTYALEIVNWPPSVMGFEMSVYGSDHIVLGSLRIARYRCELNSF